MVTFMIYLLVMCEQIAIMVGGFAEFFTFVAVVTAVIAVIVSLIVASNPHDDGLDILFQEPSDYDEGGFWKKSAGKSMLKTWKWIACIAIMLHTVEALIPSQKNMAMIIAGSATYHAVTSEPAQRIGGKALDLLEKKLDEAIDKTVKEGNNNGSQTKEEKEIEQAPQHGETPKSGGQKSA